MIIPAFMGEHNETRRHESLAAIRRKEIWAPFNDLRANHLDIANGFLIVDKSRLRIGHRITLFSAGADVLGRELLAATVTAGSQYFAASDGRFAGAETMAPFADQAARLKCALHRVYPTYKISIKKAAKSCGHLVVAADKCAAAESQALAQGLKQKNQLSYLVFTLPNIGSLKLSGSLLCRFLRIAQSVHWPYCGKRRLKST